jgi:hypothetical protein
VVTDKDGRFSFPASKLAPGQYSLGVRAVGYDLDPHKAIDITEQKTTTIDLQLRKTEDLAAQLSNGEWRRECRYWHLADIASCTAHVCFWHKADILLRGLNICFGGKSPERTCSTD